MEIELGRLSETGAVCGECGAKVYLIKVGGDGVTETCSLSLKPYKPCGHTTAHNITQSSSAAEVSAKSRFVD